MSGIEVKAGVINNGLVYELKLVTALAAKLVKDETVSDFWIVQNPKEIDKFDDIILKVTYNGDCNDKIFLIQAKHKETKPLLLRLKDYEDCYKNVKITRANNKTTLEKALHSVDFADYYFCIFTNVDVLLKLKEETEDRAACLIDIGNNGRYKKLLVDKVDPNFKDRFYVFTEQPNYQKMVSKIIENLDVFTESMIYHLRDKIRRYMAHFVNGCYEARPLTKHVFMATCMEVAMCHQISTYMTSTKEIDHIYMQIWNIVFSKRFIFIAKNQLENVLPLIASYYEEKISKFLCSYANDIEFKWNNCFNNMFRLDNSVRNSLSTENENMGNLIDLLLDMWKRDKLPLLINSIFLNNLDWLVRNDERHFIIVVEDKIPSEVLKKIRSESSFAETVFDFRDEESIMSIKLSLQGRERIPLKQISGNDDDVLKSISISALLLWTAKEFGNENFRQLGENLKPVEEDYIPRIFLPGNQTEETIVADLNNNFTVISNEAGMGKSTVLRSLARKYSNDRYVISCNLSDCTKDFDKIATPSSDALQYFYEKTETKRTEITDAVYKYNRTSKKLVLFLDSYDEILPKHEESVVQIIKKILALNVNLYTTMRVQAESKFRSQLGEVRLLKLIEFTDQNIEDYCKKAKDGNTPYDFLRIPLNLKMYADYYKEVDKVELNKTSLYRHFVSRKIEEFYKNRKIDDFNIRTLISGFKESAMKHHCRIAVVMLFGQDLVDELGIFKVGAWQKTVQAFEEYKLSFGMVTSIDPVKFIHRTFAEYLAAKYLASHPNKTLYLKIITDKSLSVVHEFLYNIVSDMAGELPRVILNGNIDRVKDILFNGKDAAAKAQKSLFPVQWAAISCHMNKDHNRRTESLKILSYIVQTAKDANFLHYNIDDKDDMLNLSWLNYLTGFTNEDYLYYRELMKCILDKNVPPFLKEEISSRINTNYRDEYGCDLFDLMTRDKETIQIFEHFRYMFQNVFEVSNRSVDTLGRNIFHHACYGGKINFVKELLRDTDLVFEKDGAGLNALHHACFSKNYEMVSFLLEKMSDDYVNSTDNVGRDAFHHACASGHLTIVKKLRNRLGINEDKNGQDGMHYACRYGSAEVVQYLLQLEGLELNVNKKDKYGKTPMHFACMAGNVALVNLLLEAKADYNLEDYEGLTPFLYACSGGKLDTVLRLMRVNMDVIKCVDGKGMTAMHHTCRGSSIELLKILLNTDLKHGVRDNEGLSIIHHACAGGNLQMVKYILNNEAGRNVFITDKRRKSPLHYACAKDHQDVVKFLISKGFDPNLPDENGDTSLHYAAKGGYIEIIDTLLSKDADANAKNKLKVTPLHLACANGCEKVVELKLNANGDPRIYDNAGWNALHHAIIGKNRKIIRMLLKRNMDPYEKLNMNCCSPMDIASVDIKRYIADFIAHSQGYHVFG